MIISTHGNYRYKQRNHITEKSLILKITITNWLHTKDVPPNHRHYCSKSHSNRSPPSQGYESTRTGSRVTLGLPKPVNTQALTGFSTHTTIQSTPTLFFLACTTQEHGPPSLPHSPSGCPSPSRAPVLLDKNLHVGTLRTRNCDQV
jgi:hypothetical protein